MGRKSKLNLRGQKADAKVKLQGTVTVNESKPVKPKTSSVDRMSASTAKNVVSFQNEIREIRTTQIRDEMKRDVHVLVVNAAQFSSLIKDHLAQVRRVAARAEDPAIKYELENVGSGTNLYSIAIKLQNEFELVLEKYLNKQSKIRWKKTKKGRVSIYYIQRLIQTEKETNFKALQRVMSDVRKELVQNSKPGTFKRATGVVIGGLDIDYNEIIPKRGVGGTAKSLFIDKPPIDPDTGNPIPGRGVQIGHFRGPATVAAAKLRELVRIAQSGIVGLTGMWFEAHKYHDMVHKFDAEVRFNDVVYNIARKELGGKVNISIVGLEQTAKNTYSGIAAKKPLSQLRKWLLKNAQVILTMKGSKSIINSIMDDILNAFNQKSKTRKFNRRVKKTHTVKGRAKSAEVGLNTVSRADRLEKLLTKNKIGNPENLNSLLALINSRLHDKIKENMGKGGSKKILNYRTGRFARSAEVKNLYDISERSAIGATVRYMKDPYQVFEPGMSHLATGPGRDPHRIIGKSIRQILQEEKLATLRRVQVELRG